ncbi:MAG: molecular chaperone DnaJ [Deltaproteobacteria bacterium]|nr:molecular chaperone DnaJ [Deltaproteobacteria bacterium]
MASKRCYYEVLGVTPDSSPAELKAAYRRLALQLHPDRHPGSAGSEECFRECAEAYEVLSDPCKRGIYDLLGHEGLAGCGHQGFQGLEDVFNHFNELFEDFFGCNQSSQEAGGDQRAELTLELEDAVCGRQAAVELTRLVPCPACGGQGTTAKEPPPVCPACGGKGRTAPGPGFFKLPTTCPTCQGRGRRNPHPCLRCRGEGRVPRHCEICFKVPPGVQEGTRLRLRGKGDAGRWGAPPGDLYVTLHLAPHATFSRVGDDLIWPLPLHFAQAALGWRGEVPLPGGGALEVELPPGLPAGHELRLAGRGVPHLKGGGRGDLVVRLVLGHSAELSPRQRQLLEEFLALEKGGNGRGKP